MGVFMKKTLYALVVLVLSMSGAKSFASTLEIKQISKVIIDSEDGTGPGGNGSVKNGVIRST